MIYNVKITTLTPVHIGSGVKYPMGLEAIADERTKKIAIVDPAKILEIIGQDNVQLWLAVIEKKENLLDFLGKFSRNLTLEQIGKRVISTQVAGAKYKKDLKEQMHSLDKPIIPGSSLKGAIRTAIITYLINQNPQKAKSIINYYRKKVPFHRWNERDMDRMSDEIVNSYLVGDRKMNANKDVMRFLQITDALFEPQTIVTLMQILNLESNGWSIKRGRDQLTEAIPPFKQSKIRININKDLLDKNKTQNFISGDFGFFSSIQKLFSIITEHTKALLEYEITLWEDEIQEPNPANEIIEQYLQNLKVLYNDITNLSENEIILRVGGYSGWEFITGSWVKRNQELFSDDEWEHIYKLLNKHRKVDIFPKTRKLDPQGNIFGFVKLEIL